MPSTYTTLTRLEDMATGENNATWGTKTDTNLILLENAVHGFAAITLSGVSYSLTANNAATDESRQQVLIFTGSPGGTATVTAPAIAHHYLVVNGTNQSILIKPSGGTGVTIPAGYAAPVYTNGTVTYFDTTYLSGAKIEGSPIGATTPAAASVTALTATTSVNFSGATVSNGGNVTTVNIDGGTIDGTIIGGSSRAAGSFTSLLASGAASLTSGTVSGALTVVGNLTAAGAVIGTNGRGTRTVSLSAPSGGSDGDVWMQYTV